MSGSFIRTIIHNQFIQAILFVLFLWFIIEVKQILVFLFISYIITAALYPFVEFLKRRKVPHTLAVLLSYTTAVLLLIILIAPLIPFFISQVTSFIHNLPNYIDGINNRYDTKFDTSQLRSLIGAEFQSIGKNALSATGKVFGGLFSFLTIFILSLYLLLDHDRIKKQATNMFAKESRLKIYDIISQIEEKLGAWLRGQLVLSIVIGVFTWIALTLLNVEYALPLAVIAGILEIVPTLGPILAAIPAVIVALTISPTTTLAVILVYVFIQIMENNLLVPKIMEKAVGLNPIVIIVATLIGAKLMGVIGALLSIPFVSMLIILLRYIRLGK